MPKSFNSTLQKLLNDSNLNSLFKKNLFTGNIEIRGQNTYNLYNLPEGQVVSDIDILKLRQYLSKVHELEVKGQEANDLVCLLAEEFKYHPLKDYLKDLVWDNIPRLDNWLIEICGCEDNQYYKDIGRKVLCAAVHRIKNPGAKFDYMLIFEGDQGMGKSTMLSILGGQWYLDTHFSTKENKQDIIDMMRTAWIVEISDLAGFNKQTIEHLKSFITRQVDRVRMPFARHSENFPRQSVFIGTHNPSGDNNYFRDDTGNRRFWPVVCSRIDLIKMRDWKDQLWAEAVIKEKDEILYLKNEDSLNILNNLHKEREQDNPLNDLIAEYVKGKHEIHRNEILEKAFKLNPVYMNPTDLKGKQTFIGIWMRKNKWKKGENKKRGWYFAPETISLEWAE